MSFMLKQVRILVIVTYVIGDYFKCQFGYCKLQGRNSDGLFQLKLIPSGEIKFVEQLPNDPIPCFKVKDDLVEINRSDKFLL